MRTSQNSGSSTIPKLGIGRGVSLAHHGERLIENPRLRSKLSCKDSSWLQISNREPMAIFRRAFSLFSGFEPQASSPQNLIANLELEFLLTHSKQRSGTDSNRKFFAIFHRTFPSPRLSRLVTRHSLAQNRLGACEGSPIPPFPWPPCGGRLIETPRLEFPATPTKQITVRNSNRDKTAFFKSVFCRPTLLSCQHRRHRLLASSLEPPASRPAPSL
jgi:hypothetical protein